jgi:ribosome-associated toxin RatA of RatAB toxin-antitoxin module
VRSEIAIDVAASPRRIFDLAKQVDRWPQLLPHYRQVTVESHDGWTAEEWSDATDLADLQLRFHHVRGLTRDMHVTWHIRPRDGDPARARITIEHVFSRSLPLFGSELFPRFVDRFFVRPIAARTLATFKQLAERPS